jgi:hypothetical protein
MREAVSADVASGGGGRDFSPVREFIFALDSRLRDRHSVFEYTSHPLCILRAQLARLDRDVCLSDGTRGHQGEGIVELHLWNEQVPQMPKEGASIGWARKMHAAMIVSMRELACFLAQRPELDQVLLLRAQTAFGSRRRSLQSARIMHGYGFEPVAGAAPATMTQRAHRAAENVLITLIALAQNPHSLRGDTFRRDRTRLYMSRRDLDRRYLRTDSANEPTG